MHVLLVSYEFPPAMATGGIGSYMQHIAYLLHKNGHNVSVISATAGEEEIVERGFCTNYLVPAVNDAQFRVQALAIFDRYFHPAAIDVMESPEVGACALAIKQKYPQIPLLVKMHTPGVLISKVSNTYQPLLTKLRYVAGALIRGKIDLGYWDKLDNNRFTNPEYMICNLAGFILSPSKALKKWATTYWQIPEQNIRVLANPFTADKDFFQFPIEGRSNTICFVGKLTVLKGMITFTPALKQLLTAYPHYNAVIIGRDEPIAPNGSSMKAWMLQELESVAERVKFTGALTGEQVKKELANSSIAVVPSLWENYPTVVLEAMAAGCAVAASNRGGIPEMITDGTTGVLFEPLKVNSLIERIRILMDDPEKRKRIATAGRLSVQHKNDEAFMAATLAIYQSLAEKKN